MTMLLSILLVLGLNACAIHAGSSETSFIVKTTLGPVEGESLCTIGKNVTYLSFKGIRYGKAPVGNLRFKPPSAAEKWTKVLKATSVGSECPQLTLSGSYTGNEDCLFLNVFSPVTDLRKKPSKLKAVMVFIYGRLFSQGSGDPALYGPDFLLENDIVFVSFNYRLGALGFLSLDDEDCTGNAGLKDQRLVLKWVQENIANFGGDPNRVTLIGESAGSVSALYHTLSDGSQGLFHRVIAMSGSPLNPWGQQSSSNAVKNAYKLGSLVGKNCTSKTDLLKTLYKASAETLTVNEAKLGYVDPPFRPVVEDPRVSPAHSAILTESPEKRYKSGRFSQIPHLLGVMSNESLTYVSLNSTRSEVIRQAKTFADRTRTQFSIASVYFAELTGKSSSRLIQETTDLLYTSGIEQTKRFIKDYGQQSIYYYSMSITSTIWSYHQKIYNLFKPGASNGDDIPYLFWVKGIGEPLKETDPISIVRERITRMWANFAKYGNPTPSPASQYRLSRFTWPEYRASGQHLDIGEDLTIKKKSSNENVDAILSSCSCRA